MSLPLKNYSHVEVIYMLSRFNKIKSFSYNIKNPGKNGVNEQNTHTPHIVKYNFRKG